MFVNFNFEHNDLTINHEIWGYLTSSKNTFALNTVLNMINDVLARDGSVRILMDDDSSIKRSIDRASEVHDLAVEINKVRQDAGLELLSV